MWGSTYTRQQHVIGRVNQQTIYHLLTIIWGNESDIPILPRVIILIDETAMHDDNLFLSDQVTIFHVLDTP